jgi:hypothetical protein
MHQADANAAWPPLPFTEWQPTCDTLHLWTQVVGKVKLALSPFLNEWWNVGLELTPRGLTTGTVPYDRGAFGIEFDFIDHTLAINTSAGARTALALSPCSVADFHRELMARIRHAGIEVSIHPIPVEVPDPVPFPEDLIHASYDPDYVHRWWRILLATSGVLMRYRSGFVGKSSPILFYWGSFDLNETRFSGRPARPPEHVPRFVRVAEDQENVACGFWPGNPTAAGVLLGEPAFYSYVYPAPPGYPEAPLEPASAEYDRNLGEFILRYEQVRNSSSPESSILSFFESAYGAAATLASWNRPSLEQVARGEDRPGPRAHGV